MTSVKRNLTLLLDEVFGEKTDYPFFARLLAFLLDVVLYLTVVTVIARIIYYQASGISKLTELIIYSVIWIAYSSFGNSFIFSGQTVGKKIFRIRVVNRAGNYLSFSASFFRSIPLSIVLNLYHVMYVTAIEYEGAFNEFVISILAIIVLGLTYLPLLSHDRQCLHDIVGSSFVIPKNRDVDIHSIKKYGLYFSYVVLVTGLLIWTFKR